MLTKVGCCVVLQTHPRLINWLNPALVKAAAWIYWVGYTLGNWDLRLPSELQTAKVEVSNKKDLLSLFLAAIEGMVTGKAIHIIPFKRSVSAKLLTLRWHLGFYSVNSLRTHLKCSFSPFTGVGDAGGEEMCCCPWRALQSEQQSGNHDKHEYHSVDSMSLQAGWTRRWSRWGRQPELPSPTQLQRPGL